MIRPFDVACFNRSPGRLLWSGTWEASTPAHAIAQACLAPIERPVFVASVDNSNPNELTVPHPGPDMADTFDVVAEALEETEPENDSLCSDDLPDCEPDQVDR